MKLSKLSEVFDAWASTDPFQAACTERATWNEEEFFAYGARHIESVLHAAEKKRPIPRGAALDFGCGPGRLAQALAAHFSRVVGVDVSCEMIKTSERLNRHANCGYVLNQAPDLRRFRSDSFDLVHSCKVLQHIRPKLALTYIAEFLRLLGPGGIAIFQVPERPKPGVSGTILRVTPSALLRPLRRIDMYGLSESAITSAIKSSGGKLLWREPCDDAGPRWTDWRYYAARAS